MNEVILGSLLLLVTVITGVLSGGGQSTKKRILRGCAVVSFLIGLVVLINSDLAKRSEKERSELEKPFGALEPGNDPTPSVSYSTSLPPTNKLAMSGSPPLNEVAVFLGTNVVLSTPASNFVVLRVHGSNLLSVSRGNSKLLVTAEVRSDDGRFIAKIRDNEFRVNPANYFYIERPDRHTLRVYEQTGGCVLDVKFLNPFAIRVLGVFRTPGKESVTITGNKLEFAGIELYGYAFHLRGSSLFEWPTPTSGGQSVWIFENDIPIMTVTVGAEGAGKVESEFLAANYRGKPITIMMGDIKKCRFCGRYFDESTLVVSNYHAMPSPH